MEWISKIQEQDNQQAAILSFSEYMDIFSKFPSREIRQSSWYLRDMFDYFGKNEDGKGYKLFSTSFPQSAPVYGQFRTQEHIYQNLINFTEEGFNNRFLLLIGPNGSSKTSLIRKIMAGARHYSKLEEGALFTFSWVFPIDQLTKGNLGLTQSKEIKDIKSYAKIEDKDIAAILQSELKDHPLLLLPIEARQDFIDNALADDPDRLNSLKKSYIYNSDLSKRNRLVYDALLKSYQGDHLEVLKHIRVERFFIDREQSSSAVTIEPQFHVDAKLQQITMDRRLSSLPPSLQSLNLFNTSGENIFANRGILEFSDLLKRPIDTFKYLLSTIESHSINLQGILTELDIFFIGSSNELHLGNFKKHPDYKSFKGRLNFIRVPYLLNYHEEEKIYQEQIKNLKDITYFEPRALQALCLWAVMTRIRQADPAHYAHEQLGKLATNMSPLDKALFLDKGTMPRDTSSEDQQILTLGRETIESEYENDPIYEGIFGVSPREMKQIIYDLASESPSITYVNILEYLMQLSQRKTEFDFLNIESKTDYHNSLKCLAHIEQYLNYKFDNDLRSSLSLVDETRYEEFIGNYISNISALMKDEKVKNPITGKFEEAKDYLIKEFEQSIELKEDPANFRSNLIGKLGAYSLDNPQNQIVYTEVFSDLVKRLKESFREEQQTIIKRVSENLIFFEREQQDSSQKLLSPEARQEIERILGNLKAMGYSQQGAIGQINHLIRFMYS